MTSRAVVALGIAQCVNWGVLYYAFAVLVLPLERELAVPTWVVTGAFSLALLSSALLAPTVGRWGDRGRGPLMMQIGGIAAAALLVVWTFIPSLWSLYIVWAGLGLCMAATLYEPAFVIIGRAYHDPGRRLRALAAVTLLGGLASTAFLPLTALLVGVLGWRGAVLVLAASLAVSTAVLRAFVFRHLVPATVAAAFERSAPQSQQDGRHGLRFVFIAAMFALASSSSAAFTSNLIPALGERGVPPATAAIVGGLMGAMQLPGRALMMSGALADSPARLLAGSLALHAAGLGGIALARSTVFVLGGAMILALGAGLATLVRPHLIQTLFSGGGGGHLNGRIARHQQLARAAGPLAVGWMASSVGYTAVFLGIAVTFALLAAMSPSVVGGTGAIGTQTEAA